jgi:potassium channel subfamily K, other eukaryote
MELRFTSVGPSSGVNFCYLVFAGFVAFSTIGYGDIGPRTGPGRVCFVVWSLLGVGTMTVLISVLSEAYQSRYSTVIQNGLFGKAIRNYQNKTNSTKQASHLDIPTYDSETMTVEERRAALDKTKVEIAKLPPKIIAQANIFNIHLQSALSHNSSEGPSPELQKALDEIMDEGEMKKELRKELLKDGDARRMMLKMYFERSLKRMEEDTERVSNLIKVQNALEASLGFGQYQEELQEKEDDEQDGEAEGEGAPSKLSNIRFSDDPYGLLQLPEGAE